MKVKLNVYFSDVFDVSPEVINNYGAFNISLINDVPLFIDPFLLFGSEKKEYQDLHDNILKYLKFLRNKSISNQSLSNGALKSWYCFPEVKQNWFGFCLAGNNGSGLALDFAKALHGNLNQIFSDFGDETITKGSHLEKLCIIKDGVGNDNISDFTTNLIKEYLLEYTQTFAQKNIDNKFLKTLKVEKVIFDYTFERWYPKEYTLPFYNNDYVILTPKDILTKDNTWINASDMLHQFDDIVASVSNDELRAQVNNYFANVLPKDPTPKDERKAAAKVYRKFASLIDYFIRFKEDNSDKAERLSLSKVLETESFFIHQVSDLICLLQKLTPFYGIYGDTYQEALQRVDFLKDVIENKDGYKLFYLNNKPIQRESDLQILYRLTWFASPSDVNREVNNGRGAVDFKISQGNKDKTLVEFKLAKNSQLRRNLEKQVEVYEKANNTKKSVKVILYFSTQEYVKVKKILKDLGLENKENVILINADSDDKISASKA